VLAAAYGCVHIGVILPVLRFAVLWNYVRTVGAVDRAKSARVWRVPCGGDYLLLAMVVSEVAKHRFSSMVGVMVTGVGVIPW